MHSETPDELNLTEHRSRFPNIVVDPRSGFIIKTNIATLKEKLEPHEFLAQEDLIGQPITNFIKEEEVDISALFNQVVHIVRKLNVEEKTGIPQGVWFPTIPINHPVLGRRIYEVRPFEYHDPNQSGTLNFHIELSDPTAEFHDHLTGIANRRFFLERAENEFMRAKQEQRPLTLALFDIDSFKKFNDTYGHEGGDRTLQAVATVASEHLLPTDIIGRWGGEEFALCLPNAISAFAIQAAETLRIKMELSAAIPLADDHFMEFPTISIGLVAYDHPDELPTSAYIAMRYADLAMYAAKQDGRNRLAICHPQEDGSATIFVIEAGTVGYRGRWYWAENTQSESLQIIQDAQPEDFSSIQHAARFAATHKHP